MFPPLLEACCLVIGRPFKLSSLHARTVRPCTPAQDLHVDVSVTPLIAASRPSFDGGMSFRPDNGRLASCRLAPVARCASDSISDLRAEHAGQVLRAAVRAHLHLHGSAGMATRTTRSSGQRRSIQGAFIPRTGARGPTSRPACDPRRARGLAHWRGRC